MWHEYCRERYEPDRSGGSSLRLSRSREVATLGPDGPLQPRLRLLLHSWMAEAPGQAVPRAPNHSPYPHYRPAPDPRADRQHLPDNIHGERRALSHTKPY